MGLFDPAVLGPAAGTPSATAHVRRRPRLAGHQRRLSRGHGHMARADRIWLLSAAAAFLYLASRKSRWPQSMPCWRVWLPADLGFFLGVYLIAATASELSLAPGGLGVFETVVTVMTAPPTKAAALGAFLAYRISIFICPLAMAIVGLALHAFRGRLVK